MTRVRDLGADGIEVTVGDSTIRCRRLVVCADAWTNQVLAGLDWQVHLTTTLEQVTYFEPEDPARFAPGPLPALDLDGRPELLRLPDLRRGHGQGGRGLRRRGGHGDDRPFEPDPERMGRLADFMAATLPGSGRPVRSKTCLYTLTNDRDFLIGPVPGHDNVLVGRGCRSQLQVRADDRPACSPSSRRPTVQHDVCRSTCTARSELDRPGVAAG